MKQPEALCIDVASQYGNAREIATRSIEARDETLPHRIGAAEEHDGNRGGQCLGGIIGARAGSDHVAAKFGLVYAGGMLAIRFNIVPWNQAEILDAIAKCFRNARGLLPDEGVVMRQGIAVLTARLRKLVRYKKLSPEKLASMDWDTADGYRRRPRGLDRFVIKREIFNSLFPTTGQRDLVLQWLIENNRITTAFLKAPADTLLREPKGQFIWPDGNRRRSYEIIFPRG
jgi:hypothetical protein